MNFITRKFFVLILVFCVNYFSTAQDPQLSLSLENPTYNNVALGGTGGTTLGASFRNQWSKVPGSFRTNSAFFDYLTYKEDWSFSGSFVNSKAGGALSRNDFMISAAYHQRYTKDFHFHYGIGLGFIQQQVNATALVFMDQISEDGNVSATSGDNISNASQLQPDLAIGGGFEYKTLAIAISAKHLTQPNITFLDEGIQKELPILWRIQAGQLFKIKSQWRQELKTFITYTQQGQASLAELDFFYRYEFFTAALGFKVSPSSSQGEAMHTDALKIGVGYRQDYLSVRYYYNHSLGQQSFLGPSHEISCNFLLYRPRKFSSIFSLN